MKLLALTLLLTVSGCAAKASGTTVQEVVSPVGGYRCFAFHNASGEVVGGNCVKD